MVAVATTLKYQETYIQKKDLSAIHLFFGDSHRVLGAQVVCEQAAHEQHLQCGGEHIEEHGGQSEVDRSSATVDGPRKRACVSVQMELQVQLV